MANLSNINNKFLVTTGGNVLIGQTGAIGSSLLQVTGTSTLAGRVTVEATSTVTNGIVDTLVVKALSSGAITNGFGVGLSFYNENTVYSAVNEVGKIAVVETDTIAIDDKMVFYVKDNNTLAERLTLTGSEAVFTGNVGIGTASPDYNLEIENASSPTIATKDTTNNVITKMFSANSQGFIGTESNHDLRVRTNNTDKITIQSGGKVGIGTTSPSSKFTVSGSDASNWISRIENTSSSNPQGLVVSIGAQTSAYATFGVYSDSAYQFVVGGDGNVGIGNTNPLAKLQITSGDSGASSPWSNADELVLESSGNAGLAFQTPNTGAATIAFQDPESVQAGFIQYLHADNALRFATNGNNERMRITSSGIVEIGAIPSVAPAILSVRKNGTCIEYGHGNNNGRYEGTLGAFGSSGFPYIGFSTSCDNSVNTFTTRGWKGNVINSNDYGDLIFAQATNANASGQTLTERMRIKNDGNVGIGTTSPNNILHISDAGTTTLVRVGNNGAYDAGIYFNTSTDWTIGTDTSNSNAFTIGNSSSVGTSPKIVIQTGGNVGIGITNPSGVLHIKKDNATAAFNIQGGLNSQTTAGTITSEINFISNDGSTTGGIATAIKSVSEISNGAHNGLAFYTGQQSRTPYLKQMLYFTAAGGLSFGDTNTAYGTSGQVLTSNGDASPSWQAAGGGSSPWTTTSNDIYNNNSGSVGIGVSSPVAKLDVNGDCSYEDVNTGTTTVITATKTLEFTVFLDGGSASLGVTYSLLTMNQPQYNTSVAVATMEYGASLDSGTGRVGGSVMAVTKWAGNWYDEDNIELGFAGTTSGKPSLFWEYGVLKVTAKRYCNMVCRIRLTYRGFGSTSPFSSPVTTNYPT